MPFSKQDADVIREKLRNKLQCFPIFPPADEAELVPLKVVVLNPIHGCLDAEIISTGATLTDAVLLNSRRDTIVMKKECLISLDGVDMGQDIVKSVSAPATFVEDALTDRVTFHEILFQSLRHYVPQVGGRLVIGVLTEVYSSRVIEENEKARRGRSNERKQARSMSIECAGNEDPSDMEKAQGDTATNKILTGVIGVTMLCFVVIFKPNIVRISGGLPVIHGRPPRLMNGTKLVNGGRGKLLHISKRSSGRFEAMLLLDPDYSGLPEDEEDFQIRSRRLENHLDRVNASNRFAGREGTTMWNAHDARRNTQRLSPIVQIPHEVGELFDSSLDDKLRFKTVMPSPYSNIRWD